MRKPLFRLGLLLLILMALPFVPAAHSQEAGQQAISRNVRTKVEPRYPELAKQYQLAGKVRLEVTVSADGTVKKTRLIGGNALLAGAALDAIKQWRFEPGSKETVEMVDFVFEHTTK